MPHFFNHIMVREEQDIPNWILDDFGLFTLKLARTFFLELGVPRGWSKFIWSSSIPPSKALVLWKFFHERLLTDQHIQNKGLPICYMCTLCEKHEESIYHLFFECYNSLHIWSWVRHIFLTSHFSNKDGLLSFIKSDGSLLVKLIKLVVITDSIWMICHMRNHTRYQDKIEVFRAISVIKDLTSLVENLTKSSMKNDMLDFNVIKFFGINTRSGKVLHTLPARWEFPSPGWVKINIDGAARGYPGLATCGGIFCGSMREFIGAFSVFLEVQNVMVAEFYGVIHAMEEAQKMGLTNVWLECDSALVYVVFIARTNVTWKLRNQWNTCLNYCGKIRFRITHIFREGNVCTDKLANFGFIHRESFHWYNRLPSSLFLELFMNRYSLLMYFFC